MEDAPIIIKPPTLVRKKPIDLNDPVDGDTSHAPTISQKRAMSARGQGILRNSHIRNPVKKNSQSPFRKPPAPNEPEGTKNFVNLRKNSSFKSSHSRKKSKDWNQESEDADFFQSLRKSGIESSQSTRESIRSSPREAARLREMADGARETGATLKEWKKKINNLESSLSDQNHAMQEVLQENRELEQKVAELTRKEMSQLVGVGDHHHHYRHHSETRDDNKLQEVLEEKIALEMEIERLKNQQFERLEGDAQSQKIVQERDRLRKKEKHLEKALSIARADNDRLAKEIFQYDSQISDRDERSFSDNQSMLERNRMRRNEVKLERSLMAVKKENQDLLQEVRSHNLEYEKIERQREQYQEEIQTLQSELDMNRRIVHTKRSLIQKEISDETRDRMENEIRHELTVELTEKITKELEEKLEGEKENELRELREQDDEKVQEIVNQIPVLENEIDRLRTEICHKREDHERAIATLGAEYEKKIDFMIQNFSDDREREGFEFIKRVDALSIENERTKELAAKEKEELATRIREEVTNEKQKEIQFLTNRVTELTKDSIDVVEKMTKEKELYGDNIRKELAKEKAEYLIEATKEKEKYAESVRQLLTEAQNQEIKNMKQKQEEITKEKDSLLQKLEEKRMEENNAHEKAMEELKEEMEKYIRQVEDLESERDSLNQDLSDSKVILESTKENVTKDAEELDASRIELESSKTEIAKLTRQKEELITMADQFKNDYIEMSNELQKIKGHFKFAVLVEYEEKIIEMENEMERLETFLEESREVNSEDVKVITELSTQLEYCKKAERAQTAEMKRLSNELTRSISQLESKESRLAELKDVVLKKETEAANLNQSVKEIQRSLDACKNELTRNRHENMMGKERELTTRVYQEKITSLNKELAKHKSRLEHCRCDGKGNVGDPSNPDVQKDIQHHQERIQRLSVMLSVAEKNHQDDKVRFEATKKRLDKDLLACTDEIEGLHAEVSRLRSLLNRSQSKEIHSIQQAPTPRIRNNESGTDRSNSMHTEGQELLNKIETAEKIIGEAKEYRSQSERIIRSLKDKLQSTEEEKRKIAQELRDSKALFREAVMSWRVETRSLKKELDQSRKSVNGKRISTDGHSERIDDSSELQEHTLQISAENEKWNERGLNSVRIRDVRDSGTRSEASIHQNGGDDPVELNRSSPKDSKAVHADETEHQDVQENNDTSSEPFTEMLDISEHTTSIEMKYDQDGEASEEAKSSAIYKSLLDFKNDYKRYVGTDESASIPTRNEGESPLVGKKNRSIGSPTSRTKRVTKPTHAPQPHLDDTEFTPRRIRISVVDARDDNVQQNHGSQQQQNQRDDSIPQSRDLAASRPQQRSLLSYSESDDSSSKSGSSKSGNSSSSVSVSERSRVLRKKMSELLEIKNSIKNRTRNYVPPANINNTARIANATDHQHKKGNLAEPPRRHRTANADDATKPNAPWGLAADAHPKLYKFLKSKSSSQPNRRGGGGDISAAPTDESLDRREALPFDERVLRE